MKQYEYWFMMTEGNEITMVITADSKHNANYKLLQLVDWDLVADWGLVEA